MFDRNSRYRDARGFAPPEGETEAFPGVRARPIRRATGVLEHRVQAGDRLDLLARQYFNDERLWWRIVDANPEFLYAGDVVTDEMLGRTILIPRPTE